VPQYAATSRPDNDRGTNFILTVTAFDRNKFNDPRDTLDPGKYSSLIYN